MSKPSDKELQELRAVQVKHDDEAYHSMFDFMLELRLNSLDPEWMAAMTKEYADSRMSRWCA